MSDRADSLQARTCSLVLVDYQARLLPAIHGGESVVRQAVALADAARLLAIPVVGTEQNPAGLGPNVQAVRDRCATTLPKVHFDACADGLGRVLDRHAERRDVVISGCEAHVCLLQTALGLLRQGRRVWVVPAACGSRRPADHALAMERLAAAGATRLAPEMALFEWLGRSDHPHFKAVLALVKSLPA